MPITQTDKVRENLARRMAARQGLALRKSRRRDPRALDYGGYWLVRTIGRREIVVVGDEHGTDLESVEQYLMGADR